MSSQSNWLSGIRPWVRVVLDVTLILDSKIGSTLATPVMRQAHLPSSLKSLQSHLLG